MNESNLPSSSTSKNLQEQTQAASQSTSPASCERGTCCLCCKIFAWFICITILLAIIIFLGWRLFTSKYTASAYLRVAYQEKPLVFSSGERKDETEYEVFKNTQMQLIKNRFILNAALRKPEINRLPNIKQQSDPIGWLINNLSVSFPGKAEIMEIKLSANDPDEAAAIVNAVVDAYMTEVVDNERDLRRQRINELDRVYAEKEYEVRNRRTELKQLAEQLGTAEAETLTLKQRLALNELASYRQELERGQFEVGRLRREFASRQAELEDLKKAEISDLECEMFAQNDAILKNLIQEIMWRKLGKQHNPETTTTEDKSNKSAEKQQEELERFEKDYAERLAQIRDEIRRKRIGEVEKEIKRLDATIEIANKQQRETEEEVDKLKKIAEQYGSTSIDVEMLRGSIVNLEKSLNSIAAEREKLRVELRSASRITKLTQQAEAVKRPTLFFIP